MYVFVFTCTYIVGSRVTGDMNRPLVGKLLGVSSILLLLLAIGIAASSSAVAVVAAAPTTYSLKFSGYDFDGQNEITLSLNSVIIGQFPAIFNTANAAKYVTFFVGPLTVLTGANSLRFTHSSLDLGVPDYVKNLTITASTGAVYYSNNTILPTVPGPLVYAFGAPTTPPQPPVGSTGTGVVGGAYKLNLAPSTFTLTNLLWNQTRIFYLNLTNTGTTAAMGLNYTLNMGTLPGGSSLTLGSCGADLMGVARFNNMCPLAPQGVGLFTQLNAGWFNLLVLQLTPGSLVVSGATYTFSVSVRGS